MIPEKELRDDVHGLLGNTPYYIETWVDCTARHPYKFDTTLTTLSGPLLNVLPIICQIAASDRPSAC